jgi:hypothetical protein
MRKGHARRTRRTAGSTLPWILLLLVVLGGLGMIVLESYEQSILERRGRDAAEAAALSALKHLYPPEYIPPNETKEAPQIPWMRAARDAFAGTVTEEEFHSLAPEDVSIGSTWVEVVVRPRQPGTEGVHAVAYGVPAMALQRGQRLRPSFQTHLRYRGHLHPRASLWNVYSPFPNRNRRYDTTAGASPP